MAEPNPVFLTSPKEVLRTAFPNLSCNQFYLRVVLVTVTRLMATAEGGEAKKFLKSCNLVERGVVKESTTSSTTK